MQGEKNLIADQHARPAVIQAHLERFRCHEIPDSHDLAGITTLARVAAYEGGFPIKVDGEIVGAIGVSGGGPRCRTTSIAREQPSARFRCGAD
jgi:uncharacterized protein GlcG (DUF336 family)